MTTEEQAKLGKSSTRLQNAGVHKLTIKAFYETNGDYPQTVIEFVTEDGLDLNYRDLQMKSDWDDEAKKFKDEKYPNPQDAGYVTNIGKAVFGKDFDMMKHLAKGAVEGIVTNKAGKVTATTEFPAMIGKVIGQGTYAEFTAGLPKDETKGLSNSDKAKAEKKKGKIVYRNQVIDRRAVFTKDLISIPEQQEGITVGKAHIVIGTKLESTFKYGKGFKDNKAVNQAIKLASGKGETTTESTTEVEEDGEDDF